MAGQARRRLDAELVRRGLARSREQAVELIAAGRVSVGGQAAGKAATQVETSAAIVVAESVDGDEEYASRGGHKLAGALAAFMPRGLVVSGRRCLDAGHRPVGLRTCCCAPVRGRSSRWTLGTGNWCGGCRPIRGLWSSIEPTCVN